MSDDNETTHKPEHPLPEEIQKMTRDETVCKFCGVSYLIHNEIKALEDKLRATEEELAFYKGQESREEALKEQVRTLEDRCRVLEQELETRQQKIQTLEENLKQRDERLHTLDRRRQDLESGLTNARKDTDNYRSKYELLMSSFPNIKSQLSQQRDDLQKLSSALQHQRSSFPEECGRVQNMVISSCTEIIKERDSLATRVRELQDNCQSSASAEADLQRRIIDLQTEAQQLKACAQEATTLKYSCDSLQSKLKDLETEIEVLRNTKQRLTLEGEQYQEQLKAKSSEVDNLTFQMRNKENAAQQNMTSLERKLTEKNAELADSKNELKTLQQKFDAHLRNEAEVKRKASQTSVEATELKERLERCRGDMEALKAEREMMISAHQTQIEQLRESFKQRIHDADQWPAKLDAAVKKERQKHAREIQALEDKLKENFVMELEIEKQKHQKLLDKCVAETRASEKQLRAQLDIIENSHEGALTDLHKQLAESKARAREIENSLREEIQSLKKIIQDLESRLARLDSSNDTLVAQLKEQVHDVERQLEDAKEVTKLMQTQWNSSKEEIFFLQETVRKECEERFELTEALSAAKEELLAFKRPAGGYPNGVTPRRTNSNNEDIQPTDILSARSSASSNSRPPRKKSEEMLIFRKSSARKRAPHPPSNPRSDASPSVSVDYEGEVAKIPGKGVKGTLNDSRRRIAQAVGRP